MRSLRRTLSRSACNLITGQQNFSGTETANLVIEARRRGGAGLTTPEPAALFEDVGRLLREDRAAVPAARCPLPTARSEDCALSLPLSEALT